MQLLRQVWRDVHWHSTLWLLLGCLIGTPLGVFALMRAPADPLTLLLAVPVIILGILLSRGYVLAAMPGRAASLGAGALSGLLNGSLAIGGPPSSCFTSVPRPAWPQGARR